MRPMELVGNEIQLPMPDSGECLCFLESQLADTQSMFGLFSMVDVAEIACEPDRFVLRIKSGVSACHQPLILAVAVLKSKFDFERIAPFPMVQYESFKLPDIFRMDLRQKPGLESCRFRYVLHRMPQQMWDAGGEGGLPCDQINIPSAVQRRLFSQFQKGLTAYVRLMGCLILQFHR